KPPSQQTPVPGEKKMAAAAELQFAQRLASNEKRCRDRALSKLRRYLSARSQPSSGNLGPELLKIWKGIFYCMWMQDKPLLQEQLAKNIAQLVHAFQNLDAKFLFMETFCQTMNREWNGIDRLRLDKFYTLIRQVLRQFLQEVRSSGWEDSLVSRFLDCLTAEVLNPAGNSAPNGVRYHFIDIYLEELATVGAQELSAEQNLKFIDPFCCIAAKTKDRVLLHSITHGIFELIVDQAPFAVEDLMKELERSEGVDDSSEDQASDSDLDEPVLGKSAAKHINGAREELWCGGLLDVVELSSDPLLPVFSLQFDYTAIAGRLFELASKSKTAAANRKRLYKLVKKGMDSVELYSISNLCR
uniref:Ribosomal RNA processing 1 n=1 Tax=Callorhinchus milii TaxID=7868 RepID=A0A4W3JV51_CALMI